MKNTKGLILDTALALFNSFGLSKVSLRTIANKMEISQGNLNYHFKKREDIIEGLYFQLVKNIDHSMSNIEHAESTLQLLFDISKTIMYNFYEYRFFLLDFVQIMRENKNIKEYHLQLTALREQQFGALFTLLIENDLMRNEILPNEYKNLYKRFQILGDFWISSAETATQPLTEKSVSVYAEMISQSIFPYLTKKGEKEYQLIMATA